MRIHIGLGLFSALMVGASPAIATVPADLCTGDPCVVSSDITVDSGSILDFGTAELRFGTNVKVRVGPGPLPRPAEFIAASIVLEPGADILGDPSGANDDGDQALVTLRATVGNVEMQSAGTSKSMIDVSDDANATHTAGSVTIEAPGDVLIDGIIEAIGNGEDSLGGDFVVDAGGKIVISRDVNMKGVGPFGGGGTIELNAVGDIDILAQLITLGSDFGGGDQDITSTTGKVTIGANIISDGGGPDGEAGEFTVAAGTDIEVTAGGEIRGRGGSGTDFDCGDGGFLTLEAGRDVLVNGKINLLGGLECFGGDFDALPGRDFVQAAGVLIDVSAPGGDGGAGLVTIEVGRNVSLQEIDGVSGFGADIVVRAPLSITTDHKILAKGSGTFGIAGNVEMSACVITINDLIDVRGSFPLFGLGVIDLQAAGLLTVAGELRAQTNNLLSYKTIPPLVTGLVDPPPIILLDPSLEDCASACGDGTVDEGETCDDGNNVSCDGCSFSCEPDDFCGDGVRECGEQCDDGNAIPGDGCEPDCTPTGQDVEGVKIQGVGKQGCHLEWLVQLDDPDTNKAGQPRNVQSCIDGDLTCDGDAVVNERCDFSIAPCLNVPDDDLPLCDPLDSVAKLTLKLPRYGVGSDPVNLSNAANVVAGLSTFGTNLEAEGVLLTTGPPVTGTEVCGGPISIDVPINGGKAGKRKVRVRTDTVGGEAAPKGKITLKCLRNDAVCGDGIQEPAEQCDDGNTVGCDSCSPKCRFETCGNGIRDCGEQCDDGALNGTVGNRCSAVCELLPPDLRLPGGGGKFNDCMMQWSLEFDEAKLNLNKKGIARKKQTCTEGDPTCDVSAAPGCQMDLWMCFGGANPLVSCGATPVESAEIRRPREVAKYAHEVAARAAMASSLASVPFPIGPGEVCSSPFQVSIPGGKGAKGRLRLSVKSNGTKADKDSLTLRCQ